MYVTATAVDGDWFTAHAGLVGVGDPFLACTAGLFFLGCREALGMTRGRALLVAGVCTGLGLVAQLPTVLA